MATPIKETRKRTNFAHMGLLATISKCRKQETHSVNQTTNVIIPPKKS